MARLIKLATQTIYSEQFDLETCIERLSGSKEDTDLLRTYMAIQTATKLTEPIDKNEIYDVMEELLSSEDHLNEPDFETILGLHKELAEVYWLERRVAILEGKLAYKTNEHSYEGLIYSIENAKRGPASCREREKFKKLAEEIAEAERELKEYLDEKASREAMTE